MSKFKNLSLRVQMFFILFPIIPAFMLGFGLRVLSVIIVLSSVVLMTVWALAIGEITKDSK